MKINNAVLIMLFGVLLSALLVAGGCDSENGSGNGNGNGGGDTPEVTSTLCGSIDQNQDSDFIDCNVSVSIINELVSAQAQQRSEIDFVRTAFINIPFLDDIEGRNFVNAAIDFNEDGEIADYDSGNGQQKEWFVVNNPVIVFPFDHNFYFEIVDSNVDIGIPYNLKIMLSDDSVESADEFNGDIPEGVSYVEGFIELSIFNFENLVNPDP